MNVKAGAERVSVYDVMLKARELGYRIAGLRGECDFADVEREKTKDTQQAQKMIDGIRKLCDKLLEDYAEASKAIWMR